MSNEQLAPEAAPPRNPLATHIETAMNELRRAAREMSGYAKWIAVYNTLSGQASRAAGVPALSYPASPICEAIAGDHGMPVQCQLVVSKLAPERQLALTIDFCHLTAAEMLEAIDRASKSVEAARAIVHGICNPDAQVEQVAATDDDDDDEFTEDATEQGTYVPPAAPVQSKHANRPARRG